MIGALDLGGTHVSAARVDAESASVEPGSRSRISFAPDGSREELLDAIVGAARGVARADVVRWAMAAAGPFDYERGICRIRGLQKLDALYGVDLRAELAAALGADGASIVFLNDAHAFLLGEWWAGAARGHDRAIGITLGTGLGSAFLADGRVVTEGVGVPPDGWLYPVEFRGKPVEESISRRALLARYGAEGSVDVEHIAERARAGEERALAVFRQHAVALAEFLGPWVGAFEADCVVVGGATARAWELLRPELEQAFPGVNVTAARNIDDAPLLGAARYALG